MGILRFDLELALPREAAFDLLDRHFRSLGYRVEESDRMGFRLILDRGWVICAILGGPLRRRHVWLRATLQEIDQGRCSVRIIFDGYRKAVDRRAAALYAEEIKAFEETCQAAVQQHENARRDPHSDGGLPRSGGAPEGGGSGGLAGRVRAGSASSERSQWERHLSDATGPGSTAAPAVVREVVIKEVVRIPCKYCGNLVENTAKKCDDCGAPLG